MTDTKFLIFSCGYNCVSYIEKHIASIRNQTYKNFRHIIVDDASTDNTYKLLLDKQDERTKIEHNQINKRWLYNATTYLSPAIQNEEEVIIIVDLDDWLPHENVFNILNGAYQQDCWVCYSKFERSRQQTIIEHSGYPDKIHKRRNFRKYAWRFSPIRTFKAFLWNNINVNDFKDTNGEFVKHAWDLGFGFPILEMTPRTKLKYIPEVLYVYNTGNPLSIMNKNSKIKLDRRRDEQLFRGRSKYTLLER